MTDLQKRLAAVYAADDEENQVASPEKAHDSKSEPSPVSTAELTDLQKRLAAVYAADDEENQVASPEKAHDSKSEPSPVSTAELETCETPAAYDLPIYTATPAQINHWHAYGSNVFLQGLLREYELDNSSSHVAAYNHFKIGVDPRRHVATFAIDENHYYAIQFNEWNSAPVNSVAAALVLEKINEMWQVMCL